MIKHLTYRNIIPVVGIVTWVLCPALVQPFTSNQSAYVVIGQPDMVSNQANQGGGPTATTLNYPNSVFTDGIRLFIADRANHRVLIYNGIPEENNASADVVVGQPDMSSILANQGTAPNANTLNYAPFAITVGPKLLISDSNNNRVLIYNSIPSSNNTNADVVIGQPDMTSVTANQGGSPTAYTMVFPHKVCFDGTNLYICDYGNSRILIYHNIPTSNNASADLVIGQPDMNSGAINQGGAAAANTLYNPAGVWSDGTRLYIADTKNHRALIYNTVPTNNNAAADIVIGQVNMTSHTANQGSTPTAYSLNRIFGLYSDGVRLFVPDHRNNRILIYNTIPTANNTPADVVIGQPDMFSYSFNQGSSVAANTFSFPLDCYYFGRKLFVGDGLNNRVLIFNDPIPTPTFTPQIEPKRMISNISVYPNPFHPPDQAAKISYTLYDNANVDIEIYTYLGNRIKNFKIIAGQLGGQGASQGIANQVVWDGRNNQGIMQTSSGYICRITIRPVNNKQVMVNTVKLALVRR